MKSASALALLLCAASAAARNWEPPSKLFSCRLPSGWNAFEEEEAGGTGVHALGPAEAGGAYRAMLHIHHHESGRPGFKPVKFALEDLRRDDKAVDRAATSIRRMAAGRGSARSFEVGETRFIPAEAAPSRTVRLHHFIAVIEDGESYFVIRLSSTEEAYVDHRRSFIDFVKSFRPAG